MDALQAYCLKVNGVAGARRECDFNQQQETYAGGSTDCGPCKDVSCLLKSHSGQAPAAPPTSKQHIYCASVSSEIDHYVCEQLLTGRFVSTHGQWGTHGRKKK
jgi:hypothetical protein